jgi:hypothetical protein
MLPNVVVRERFLVGPVEALEAGVGITLLVLGPRDALGVQEVDDGADVGREGMEVVVVHTEVVAAYGCRVVGLAGVGCGVVVCQCDTLGGEPFLVGVAGGGAVVL